MTLKLQSMRQVLLHKKLLVSSVLAIGIILTALPFTSKAVDENETLSSAEQSLKTAIDTILADSKLSGAQASVLVRSASDGKTVYEHNPDSRLIPASNTKLYTSSTAMELLGPNYTFSTSVATTGTQARNVLIGDLYLKGTGDPTIRPEDYDKLARDVANKGIKHVTGSIVADDTFFDTKQLGNNWTWDNAAFSWQPEISALTVAATPNFDIGSLTVRVTPGANGQKPKVNTIPETNYVKIQNDATTGAPGSPKTLYIERKLGVNTIVITGSIPAGSSPIQDLSTVTDTTGYVATLFKDALKRHGVRIDNTIKRTATPANAKLITQRTSEPLSKLYPYFMKLSNNGIAEILIKSIGKKSQPQGTWDNGLISEVSTLKAMGIATDKLQIVDGSGLSNLNFIAPEQTTELLLAARSKPWFNTWYDSLPIAGISDPLQGGTLRSRMAGTKAAGNVHAKTGSLFGASALSGYVTSSNGEKLVFSIMENNYLTPSVKYIEDAIAITLANYHTETGVDTAQKQNISNRTFAPTKDTSKDASLECSWTKEGC